MGFFKSLLKAFNCKSECSLNQEIEELQKFIKKLALEDLQELYEYYKLREQHLMEKKQLFRETASQRISEI